MKKVLVGIFAVIAAIVVIVVIFGIYMIRSLTAEQRLPETGIINKNGAEALYIRETVTTGKGGVSYCFWENDGVMLSDSQDNVIVCGITFIPQKSGRCVIAADDYFCGDFESARIFDVTVDENLTISYTQRNVDKFFLHERIPFENCQMTVQKDGNSTAVQKQTAVEIGNAMSKIYGEETLGYINAPDLSKCTKIICVENMEEYNYVVEFYISEEKMYYCNIMAGFEQWYEFVPDELCSLDGINELLDLKD